MKKYYSWMLAAILLICGLALTTSCGKEEAPFKLDGTWYGKIIDNENFDIGESVHYLLLDFGQDGVLTGKSYEGFEGTAIQLWDRFRRHSIYTVDEPGHVIYAKLLTNDETSPVSYQYSNGTLTLTVSYGATNYTVNLTRPTQTELEMLAIYDNSIPSNDYIGAWFGGSEFNQLYTYVMNEYFENGRSHTIRYSYYKPTNECTRTETDWIYDDLGIVDDEQLIELTKVGDPTNVSTYWWTVENNVLTLGHTKYESMESDFQPLTRENLELMAELDKLCK